jgi:hypothetical protein
MIPKNTDTPATIATPAPAPSGVDPHRSGAIVVRAAALGGSGFSRSDTGHYELDEMLTGLRVTDRYLWQMQRVQIADDQVKKAGFINRDVFKSIPVQLMNILQIHKFFVTFCEYPKLGTIA